MTEQELGEKLFEILNKGRKRYPETADKDVNIYYPATIFLPEIIKEILALIKEAGYVKLAEDQSLPKNEDVPEQYNDLACGAEDDSDNISKAFYELAQQDMLKGDASGVWLKVKLEEK